MARFVLEVQHTYKTFIEVEASSKDEAEDLGCRIVLGKTGRTTVWAHPQLREAHDHPGWKMKAKVKGTLPEDAVWSPPVPLFAPDTRIAPTPKPKVQ